MYEYKMLAYAELEQLEAKINDAAKNGWSVHCMCVSSYGNNKSMYCVMMIRNRRDK